ncbi:MAG: zinc-dependent metalloprotease, partial [Candidatus Dormiibacterota bacterium]
IALVAEASRPLGGHAELLDWDEVARLAKRRLGEGRVPDRELARAGQELNRLAGEVEGPLLEAVGGLPAGASLPRFEAVDRLGWLDRNLSSMRPMVDPLLAANPLPKTRLTEVGRAGIDRYLAFLFDLLARRVLGQFDPQLGGNRPLRTATDGQSLYLVDPNVTEWQQKAEVNGEDLRRWLILHELTHAWQFAAHPWLRDHLNGSLARLLGQIAGQRGANPLQRWLRLTIGAPDQWRTLQQVQATMSLVEGYGNLLMNVVGRRILPAFDSLEAAYEHRRGSRSVFDVLVSRLTGLELKMQQYRIGEAFCERLYDLYGMDVLNLAWDGPDNLPRANELRDPERWYRRVVGVRPRLVRASG